MVGVRCSDNPDPDVPTFNTREIDILCIEGLSSPVVLTLYMDNSVENDRIDFTPVGIKMPAARGNARISGLSRPSEGRYLFAAAYGNAEWRTVARYIKQQADEQAYSHIYIVADSEEEIKLYSDCIQIPGVSYIRLPSGTSCSVGDVVWALFVQLGVGRLGFD